MAKVKVVNNNLDQNINGDAFLNTASQTIFQFGGFAVTSNFEGRTIVDYTKELSTFVTPVTLETLQLTETESEVGVFKTNNAILNLDNTDLNTFVKFGSAYEFLRISIQNIIVAYPGSLFVNSQVQAGGNETFYDFNYDANTSITTFKIPSRFTDNKFGLVYNYGNDSIPDDTILKNLNLSYFKYVVWSTQATDDNGHAIIGFTGDTSSRPYLMIECIGNPFPFISGDTVGRFDIHLKPNTIIFDDYRILLKEFEQYIIASRNDSNGFKFDLKEPVLLDDGTINYNNKSILWTTGDGYNIDIDTPKYQNFLDIVLGIGDKYDQAKTDLIARFLTPASIKTYDLTDEKKSTKLLRIYGKEFDQIKQFIDSLVYVNKVTYDKKNNLPDQIVSNLARTFGWNYFQLVNEEELVDKLFGFAESERDLNTDLTPAEVDIELWRRILINTNYFWKSKGTRDAIKSMFLLIGIPEPFINITEYVYTVDGRIDPREVTLTLTDLPSASLPYDENGYPVAPIESNEFFFQISGDTDGGQAYMNNFRNVGFNISAQVDNKKSWIEAGSTYRRDDSSPTYFQQDSKLVLNTKEVDVALDTARGIEWDVWRYIKEIDFPANSSGYTLPYSYINLSLGLTGATQSIFELPDVPEGDVEVRFNGILLNYANYYDGTGTTKGIPMTPGLDPKYHTDYDVSGKTIQIFTGAATDDGTNRDVIEATYLYKDGAGISQVTVKYIVARIAPNLAGTIVPLPDTPSGDVQLTINGVAATKGSPQFYADYIVNPNNPQELIIQNPDLITYFATNPYTQVAFISVTGSSSVYARSEITRVDSLCGGKLYFNANANKAVYRLNYKIINPSNVKILVDGIALEPGTDYTVNPNNPYEVYLPPNINFGSVVSAYYIVGDSAAFDPIIDGGFGLGDISQLSFLEFIELIQRKLINASNRKIITDFKGGWYPTLLKVYITYLHRANLTDDFKTNGYTFSNLYPFLNKYNAFFQQFVDQLLSVTIIQGKGGLLIRNTVFTKQKFTYKRGVSFDTGLNYFGDDGATYLKRPLQQSAEWTDDAICIPDVLCDDFIVSGITINYPTTTTTTTQFPYSAIMRINEVFTLITSTESTEKYQLEFDPVIPPGYSVEVDLDYSLNFSGGTNDVAEITVTKNSVVIYHDLRVESGIVSHTGTTAVIVESGDVVEITSYLVITGGGTVESQLIPTIVDVQPNGSISSIIPSQVFNNI